MSDVQIGRKPAKSLFKQYDSSGPYDLEEFRRVFVQLEDVTEYKAAIKLVGSWAEWERIKSNFSAFNGFLQEWISEIEVRLKSRAMQKIQELADSDDRQAYNAAKFIATQEYKRRHGTGRPTKAEKEREAKAVASAAAETKEEKDRILHLLQGGKDV